MNIELLYFDGCPNWTVADQRLAQALGVVNPDLKVVRRRVETVEEAEKVGFTGSPTVLIDGRDPFATGDEQVGLACRVYATPEGFAGSPTVEHFVDVLT